MDLNGYKEIRDAYGSINESLADAPAANTPAAAAPNAKEAFPKDRVERAKKQASPKNAVKEEEEQEQGEAKTLPLADSSFLLLRLSVPGCSERAAVGRGAAREGAGERRRSLK